MTLARRRHLEALAYPDPLLYARRLNRTRALLVAACVLGVAHLYIGAIVVLLIALPGAVACVRQQLALGALLADAMPPVLPRTPQADLRDVYRRLSR